MKIQVVENPSSDIMNFFEKKIEEFNIARWDIKEKTPLAIVIKDDAGDVVGGASAKTFGNWLLIDNIWISESQRGKNLGTKVLLELEKAAVARGCRFSLLDTLDFQARPFYEKNNYKVQWAQEQYPTTGAKFFMVKAL